MGFSNGTPTIVTDGLVFAVDAGNGQSYVSGSLDTFSLVSSDTGSIHNDVDFNSANQGSWVFDGADDNINCGHISQIQNASKVTISFWINLAQFQPNYLFGQNLVSGDNVFQMYYHSIADRFYIWIKSGGTGTTSYLDTSAILNIEEWNHFTMVFDGTQAANDDRCKLYINGGSDVITNRGTMPTTFVNSTEPFLIARGLNGYFTGEVANTLIYNKALSEAEVTQNYNATKGRFT